MDFLVDGIIQILDLRAALSVLPYLELSETISRGLVSYEVADDWLTFKVSAPYLSSTGKPTGVTFNRPIGFRLLRKSVLRWPSSPLEVWGDRLIIPTAQGEHPEQPRLKVFDRQDAADAEWGVTAAKSLWWAWVKYLRHCTMQFVDGEWVINHPAHGNIKVVKE